MALLATAQRRRLTRQTLPVPLSALQTVPAPWQSARDPGCHEKPAIISFDHCVNC